MSPIPSPAAQARIAKLVQALKKLKPWKRSARGENGDLFAMDTWRETWDWGPKGGCGSVACIAGTAQVVLDDSKEQKGIPVTHVAELLELSKAEANELFVPTSIDLNSVTKSMAIKVLQHYAKTGEVNWSICNG